jgi:hypothetical protein
MPLLLETPIIKTKNIGLETPHVAILSRPFASMSETWSSFSSSHKTRVLLGGTSTDARCWPTRAAPQPTRNLPVAAVNTSLLSYSPAL